MELEKIGKFIKKLREKNNMTQEELAEKLCCVRSNIAHIESGRTLPSHDKVQTLAKIFNVAEADIYAGRILKRKDGVPIEIYNIISILNSKSKRRFAVIIVLLIFLALILFAYYFFTFRNSIKVYNVSGQTENFKIDNGLFFLTKEEIILTLNVNSTDNQNIKKIALRYKTKDSDNLVIETDSSYLYVVDFYNYNAYFDYNSVTKGEGDFYIEISVDDQIEKLDLTLTKEYTNKNIFLKKEIPISDGTRYTYPIIEVPSKINELFTKEENNMYTYTYKEKGILYVFSYDADNGILNVIEGNDDWNKSFIYYSDIKDIVYSYSVGDKVKDKYDFNIYNMNEDEKEVYEYFEKKYIEKYLK